MPEILTKEQLIQFLKENLSIEKETHYGSYGTSDTNIIVLKLCGEEISSLYLD